MAFARASKVKVFMGKGYVEVKRKDIDKALWREWERWNHCLGFDPPQLFSLFCMCKINDVSPFFVVLIFNFYLGLCACFSALVFCIRPLIRMMIE
jgi:hypothetical protein